MILVTGASGFVGSAVARQCWLQAGEQVRALVRPDQFARQSRRSATGDRAGRYCRRGFARARHDRRPRICFMSPPITGCGRATDNDIVRTNVEGTRTVMERGATRRRRAHRLHVERRHTDVAAGRRAERRDVSARAANAVGAYKYSKVVAERLVEAMVAEQKLPAVIVNPSTPIGPGDVRPTPTGRIIVEAAAGRMPVMSIPASIWSMSTTSPQAMSRPCRRAASANAIFSAARMYVLGDMLREIARRVGRAPPKLRLPRQLIFPIAYGAEAIAHFTGREPFVTTTGLKLAKDQMFFTSAKAERELGYQRAALWRGDRRRHRLVSPERLSEKLMRRVFALAQEVEELDALAQAALHHVAAAAPSRRRSRRSCAERK